MRWDDVLNEVVKRKEKGLKAGLLSDEGQDALCRREQKRKLPGARSLAEYGLGEDYGDTYFTKREAECMVLLLKGKTVNNVAMILELSPRTVEYYLKNMKTKIGCRTKFELIDLVHASEFMDNVDF